MCIIRLFPSFVDYTKQGIISSAYTSDFYLRYYFFERLWKWCTNQITKNTFLTELKANNILYKELEKDGCRLRGSYDIRNGCTIVSVTHDILKLLKTEIKTKFDAYEYSQLFEISRYFWNRFVREYAYIEKN